MLFNNVSFGMCFGNCQPRILSSLLESGAKSGYGDTYL